MDIPGFIPKFKLREFNTLYGVLCILVFSMAVVTNQDLFFNGDVIWLLQMLFIVPFLWTVRQHIIPGVGRNLRASPWTSLLLGLWVTSLTMSYISAPFDFSEYSLARIRVLSRYVHTLTYVVFFFCVRDLLIRNRLSATPIIFSIIASVFFVAVCFPVNMMFSETYTPEFSKQWYNSPVFNMHIRHTGYQVTAACAALLIFLHARSGFSNLYLLMSLVLWTFLFWCGGRAAVASLMVTGLLVGVFLYGKQLPLRRYLVSLVGIGFIAFLFSEWLSVFHWNGLIRGVERSLQVEGGFESVSTGRLQIWLTTIEYFVRYPFFGLGPEGYVFMPGRVYGVHPHNIFLQFLIEWGLIGTILFLTILARGFFAGFMLHVWSGRASPATLSFGSVAGGCIIIALGIHSLTDGTLYHPYPSACLAIAFAIWTMPSNLTSNEDLATLKNP